MKSLEVWYQDKTFGFKAFVYEMMDSKEINKIGNNPFMKINKIIQR